jgi:succinate dehydrogenase / fumarate reductase iron-sulfur subunit
MSCGCCLEACPQFNDKESFIGAHAVSQAVLFNTIPAGKTIADERLDVLAGFGGIAACGNAQNCAKVCPKDIPLLDSIARAGRAATVHAIKRSLGR